MNSTETLIADVHFHQQDEVSIFFESNISGEQEMLREIHLFILFALRQMSNLGEHEVTESLADALNNTNDAIGILASSHEIGGVRLIRYPGTAGVKRFTLRADFRADGETTFDLDFFGFADDATGMGYYAPASVLALLRFFALKRSHNRDYLSSLARAAINCGAQRKREMSHPYQTDLAQLIMRMAVEPSADTFGTKGVSPQSESATERGCAHVESGKPSDRVIAELVDDAAIAEMWSQSESEENVMPSPMSREFDCTLSRSDGTHVTAAIWRSFENDDCEWYYDNVRTFFTGLPESEWSQSESINAEIVGRNIIGFYQSIYGARIAVDRGLVPRDKMDWFVDWLLRLNLGDTVALQAMENWYPISRDYEDSKVLSLLIALLSKSLPGIRGQVFVLSLFAHTLEIRIKAAVELAFGVEDLSNQMYADARDREQNLRNAFKAYSSGGGFAFALENDKGIFLKNFPDRGPQLQLWSTENGAQLINIARFGGRYRVFKFDYRDLFDFVLSLRDNGVKHVAIDGAASPVDSIIPIQEFANRIESTIRSSESTEFGIAAKRGLADSQ